MTLDANKKIKRESLKEGQDTLLRRLENYGQNMENFIMGDMYTPDALYLWEKHPTTQEETAAINDRLVSRLTKRDFSVSQG